MDARSDQCQPADSPSFSMRASGTPATDSSADDVSTACTLPTSGYQSVRFTSGVIGGKSGQLEYSTKGHLLHTARFMVARRMPARRSVSLRYHKSHRILSRRQGEESSRPAAATVAATREHPPAPPLHSWPTSSVQFTSKHLVYIAFAFCSFD